MARIYKGTPTNLARLAKQIRKGGIVGVPTETVYGLAANALDETACRKIFRAKGRPARDPLIVHLASARELERVAESNSSARKLAARFWPGPLTLVLPKKPVIPDVVSAGLPSVAVRVPAHPLFRKLLKLAGVPLAAPSANRFGYISPTTAEHVRAGLGSRIRHILDGGPSAIGIESTILDLRDERKPRLLRPGAITRAELEAALGRRIAKGKAASGKRGMVAPGMLRRHYSPRTPVVLHKKFNAALVRESGPKEAWVVLDPNLRRAARGLFAVLRKLDDGSYRRIHVELARGGGLADAINDRLRRAAAR